MLTLISGDRPHVASSRLYCDSDIIVKRLCLCPAEFLSRATVFPHDGGFRNLPSGAVRGVRGVRRAGRASATCTGLVSRQLAWRSQAESCHARGVLRRHLAPPLQTRHLCRAIAEGSNDKDQSECSTSTSPTYYTNDCHAVLGVMTEL